MTDMTDRINLSPNSEIPDEALMLCAADKGNDPSCVIGKDVRIACAGADLVGGAAKLEKAAAGWWTVVYTVPTRRQRRVEDGADEEGNPVRHMETFDEVNTVVRGWRKGQAFLAVWSAGSSEGAKQVRFKAECAYWWTREHEAWAELPRERVTWTTPQPTPVRVSFAELTRLVKSEV